MCWHPLGSINRHGSVNKMGLAATQSVKHLLLGSQVWFWQTSNHMMKFIGNFVSKFAHFHDVFLHELLVFDYHNLSTTTMEGDRQPMLEGKFIMYIPVVC